MMTEKRNRISFTHFLEAFPEIELPIILSEDSISAFNTHNKPMPQLMIDQYIMPYERDIDIEITEFVPCFSIPETHEFRAVVYWKASLMSYEYILMTFTKKGQFIAKKVIAGSTFRNNKMVRSVATIDPDWMIYVAGGVHENDQEYDASNTKTVEMELLPDGNILSDVKW